MSNTHEVVVLGSNFAGIGQAHYILKNIFPALKQLDSSKNYHLTLVGPAASFYFKVATPRVLADPSRIDVHQSIIPLTEGFSGYPAEQYTYEQGLATALDESAKTITVTYEGKEKVVPYNSLVIATGIQTSSPLWSIGDDLSQTRNLIKKFQEAIPKSKTVLIAGGGPVGVETAGEINLKYPKVNVTLLSGGERVLARLNASTSGRAERILKQGGTVVKHKLRVSETTPSADGSTTTVKFDNGTTETYDLYIDATGFGKPNTAFLPKTWLNERGRVQVNGETLRVEGAKGVYAIGDVASYSSGGVIDVYNGTAPVGTSLGRDIAAEVGLKTDGVKALQEAKFKGMPDTQLVPIGSKGVGQIMGWWVPSFFVWLMKGRHFFIPNAIKMVKGDA